MLKNILLYVVGIINFMVWCTGKAFILAFDSLMFCALFICGALGFGVFILFLLFMLGACGVALGL